MVERSCSVRLSDGQAVRDDTLNAFGHARSSRDLVLLTARRRDILVARIGGRKVRFHWLATYSPQGERWGVLRTFGAFRANPAVNEINNMQWFQHCTAGRPLAPATKVIMRVIKGTRLAVEFILELLAVGESEEYVLSNYPRLMREDVLACLSFAAYLVHEFKAYPIPA